MERPQASNIVVHSIQMLNVCLGARKIEVCGKCSFKKNGKYNLMFAVDLL